MPDAGVAVPQADSADYGSVGTVRPGTSGRYGWLPVTFLPGMVFLSGGSGESDVKGVGRAVIGTGGGTEGDVLGGPYHGASQ